MVRTGERELIRTGRNRRHAMWTLLLSATLLLAGIAWAGTAQGTQPQQPAAGPPTTAPAKPGTPGTVDPDAIRKLIEQKLRAMPKVPPARKTPPKQAKPRIPGRPGAAQPAQKAGCGGPAGRINLTPPPPDQPQPRWACEQPEVDAGRVWRGKKADYVFKIRNTGEGELKIQLKRR